MKKMIPLFLCAVLILSLVTGCAVVNSTPETSPAETSSAKTSIDQSPVSTEGEQPDAAATEGGKDLVKFGVSISKMSEFNADQFAAYDRVAAESSDPKVEFLGKFDCNRDPLKQMEQLNVFKQQGADAIFLALYDVTIAKEYVDAAGDMGVVFVSRGPIDEDLLQLDNVCFIGGSEYSAGRMQAEYMSKLCKEKELEEINYVVLIGDLSSPNATERTKGVKDAMEECGIPVNIVAQEACNWSRAEAMSKTEQLISSGKKIDVIFANSDDIALGAMEAIKAAGKQGEILIAGLDGTVAGVTGVRDGDLSMTVLQNGRAQAAQAIQCGIDYTRGIPLEPYYDIPFEPITPENIEDYLYILE